MPKRSEKSPADAGSVTFNVDLTLPAETVPVLCKMAQDGENDSRKISSIAMGLLLDMAEGATLIGASIVKEMTEAFGKSPSPEEISENFQKGLSRIGGGHFIVIRLQPEQIEPLKYSAEFNGFDSVEQAMQNLWDYQWDQGNMYDFREPLERVLMTKAMKEKLVQLLGKDFSNGAELGELIEENMTSPSFLEVGQ